MKNGISHGFIIGKKKYTVEELNGNKFISTFWDMEMCLEHDRHVEEFETYSSALAHMYRSALVDNVEFEEFDL